jgi:amino acid permease
MPVASPAGAPTTHAPICPPSLAPPGHAVFPSLYSSMAQPQRWSRLLALCFAIAVVLYAGMALLGAAMFGPGTADNVTLNMQQAAPTALPTVLAMWLVIVSPLTKIGLTLAPVAMAVRGTGSTALRLACQAMR